MAFDEKKWMKSALLVQDACNLAGVVHSFAKMLTEMNVEGGFDHAKRDAHPATVLFVDKIYSMVPHSVVYLSRAYAAAQEATKD
jgi:glyoxylate utilization-related uncharacterized protein